MGEGGQCKAMKKEREVNELRCFQIGFDSSPSLGLIANIYIYITEYSKED